MTMVRIARWSIACALALATGAAVQAQTTTKTQTKADPKTATSTPAAPKQTTAAPKGAQTATQFYMEYEKAFEKAKKPSELDAYLSMRMKKLQQDQMKGMSAADVDKMWGMAKELKPTGIKVVKEETTPTGATLTISGVGPDKSKATGTVKLVKEGGAFKLDDESWKM
jgi:hypothetical protein